MYRAIIVVAVGLLFFASIVIGLCDLFRGVSLQVALIALAFVIIGIFNTWAALDLGNRRREPNQASKS
jgi:uncharacterized membrane protein HdeD (DUF308 family)